MPENNQTRAEKNMKKFFKILIIIILSFVAVFVFYFIFITIANKTVKDIAPINDSKMDINIVPIEDKANSYLDLKKIHDIALKEEIDSQELEKYVNLENYNKNEVEKILKKYKKIVNIVDVAINKKNFQNQDIITNFKNNDPTAYVPIAYLRIPARLYIINSNYLFKNGQEEKAFNNLDNLLKLYNKIGNSEPQSTYQFLGTVYVFDRALNAQRQYLQQTKLDNVLLKNHQILLSNLDISKGLLNSYKGEYFFAKKNLNELSSSNNISNYYFLKNECHKLFYDSYIRRINYIDITFSEFIKKNDHYIKPEFNFLIFIKYLFAKNSTCKILNDLDTNLFEPTLKKKHTIDFYITLNKLVFANRLYFNDNQKLPNKLEDLVPKYIEALPIDTFSGTNFGYDSQNKTIYSTVDIELVDTNFSINF